MKVFISQPMRGRDPETIREERKKIIAYVEKLYPDDKVEEIKSFFGTVSINPLRMLGTSIEMMSDADLVVFAPSWIVARGCKIEHECAVQYNLKILDLED